MDTLSWAIAGTNVTGLDFSIAAIDEANSLAERAGLSERASFVCANVYDALEALQRKRFDVVYVSLGSLCWLPDVATWAGLLRTSSLRGPAVSPRHSSVRFVSRR